jgi:hypothetical protein
MAEKKATPAPTPEATTQVVDWQEQLAKMAFATAQAEKPSGNWVSFKHAMLTVNGTTIPGNKMNSVVIHSIFENQWYENPYNADNPESPACYAFSETDEPGDLKPHPDSAKPQSPTCDVCPKNEWKSDPKPGSKGKWCKNVRRLALIHADDLNVDKLPKAEVALAKLPVTSVANWSTYASQIANVLKLPPLAVVTEISVKQHPKNQLEVNFDLVDKIDGSLIPALLNKRLDVAALIFAPYDKSPTKPEEAAQPRKY